jgi:mevalonate kinase
MSHSGGKVILCGEHAVVYGQDAIAVGLPSGVTATARLSGEFGLRLNQNELGPSDLSVDALAHLYAALGRVDSATKVHLTVDVTMPLGVGLGGSAAMGVAIAKAIAECFGHTLQLPEILVAAAAWERVFHGNPSGVDAAAAALGGCLRFNRHAGATPVPLEVPLHLALAVAGPPSLTKAMVAQVAEHKQRDPQRFESTLAAIQAIVVEAEQCVRTGALQRLGHLLTENHLHLRSWQLSTPAIDEACAVALQAGALGAKLTGAGGGGCVLALCSAETLDAVHTSWRARDLTTFSALVPID